MYKNRTSDRGYGKNDSQCFCEYMKCVIRDDRFNEICYLYLKGMLLDDLKYMHPEDLINIVPPTQYQHKLLMSIMVRRYLCSDDEMCHLPRVEGDTVGQVRCESEYSYNSGSN